MSGHETKMKRVLFIDDEPAFLEIMDQAFTFWGGGQWEIHQATEVGQALRILQETTIDLVVVDIRMPTVDGIQLLGLLRRKYPSLIKAVLTGYASEEYRAACLAEGAELFLEKPQSPDGLHSLYAALSELVKWQPEQGFRGVLRKVGLEDVLQMECLGGNSSVLEVSARAARGQIFVKNGRIIHAQIGERTGEDALHEILAMRGGEFQLKPFSEPAQTTIESQWEFLLMEAARKRDESGRDGLETEAVPAAPEPSPDSSGDISTEWAPLPHQYEHSGNTESIPQAPLNPSGPGEDLSVGISSPEMPRSEERVNRDLMPTRIDELVISSAQGELIYQWQCPDSNARVSFLEFLSMRGRQLAQSLPMGRFDRIEMQDDHIRVVAQVQADRGVVVRSSVGALTMRK